MTVDDRVIVAGAGPVGLATALALAQRGVPVTVLEAEPGLTVDLRAGSFHPPTLEMLADLGVAEAMHEAGIVVRKWQYRERVEGVVATFDLGLLADETPYPYWLHLEQHRLTPILLHCLRAVPGFEIRFGAAVSTVAMDEDRVHVGILTPAGVETVTGRWLVGADGGHSQVRKALAIDFAGFTWPERFVVASTTFDLAPLGFADTAYIADPALWSAVFRVPDDGPPGLWRIAYGSNPEEPDAVALAAPAVQRTLALILPDPGPFPLKYCSSYRVHQRVAETFRRGRVLLAGDAAYVNNPLGGFGLNGGIHDAANLAAKLAEVWHGRANPSVLDLYDRQRRPVNIDYVQATNIHNKRLMEERDPEIRRQRNADMAAIAADPAKAKALLMTTSMLASVRKAATIA